jgi:hypothetical protein
VCCTTMHFTRHDDPTRTSSTTRSTTEVSCPWTAGTTVTSRSAVGVDPPTPSSPLLSASAGLTRRQSCCSLHDHCIASHLLQTTHDHATSTVAPRVPDIAIDTSDQRHRITMAAIRTGRIERTRDGASGTDAGERVHVRLVVCVSSLVTVIDGGAWCVPPCAASRCRVLRRASSSLMSSASIECG